MSCRPGRARWLGLAPILAVLCALFGAQPAAAAETCTTISGGSCHPYWRVDSRSAPLNLPFAGEQLVAANDEAIKGKGQLTVLATNLGDAPANGATEPITVTDELPEGVELQEGTGVVEAITGGGVPEHVAGGVNEDLPLECKEPTRTKVECVFKETPTVKKPQIVPFNHLELRIPVKITRSSSEGPAEPLNKVTVSGGEAAEKKLEQKLKITGAAEEVGGKKVSTTKFGAEHYELVPENENGEVDTQAGSHPFQLTSVFDLNQTYGFSKEAEKNLPEVPALQKNLDFKIPAGVLGNPDAVPQCPDLQFGSLSSGGANQCLDNTVIGVATVEFFEPNTLLLQTWSVPVFNLVPAPGEPAKLGFEITHVPVVLDTSVRTGSDYGVTINVLEASGAVQVLGAAVTLWGTPGDPAHDSARGWNCLGLGRYHKQDIPPPPCGSHEFEHPVPFLLLPTSCKNPLLSEVTGEAWSGQPLLARNEPPWAQSPPPSLTGCESLEFNPSIKVEPDTNQASTPAGMNVEVSLPQQETTMSPTHNGEADVRSTTLALPPGVQASAGAATGLSACGTGETGLLGNPLASSGFEQQFTPNPASCPEAAKIGTVEVNTPLLPHPLTGSLYLGDQNTNPFAPPLVLYLIASEEEPVKHEWSKVLIKLAGEVKICQAVEGPCQEVGQLVSTFRETPQAPFEHLKIHLFGGGRASQATPARCGESYEAQAQFSAWPEGVAPATRSSKFAITSGPGGGPCPGPGALPFAPSFRGGAANTQAGAFTPFVITLGHRDGDQALTGLSMHLPEGAAAMLASVTPCPVAVADAGQCPSSSLIGHSMTSSGLGGSPVNLPGEAFLTESLRPGAPFGVSVLTNAEHVGPFDIGKIIANSTIQVDKDTAAATITAVETRILESNGNTTIPSTSLPTMIKGVPVQLKQVIVSVDRPNFEFNPTTCAGRSVRGAATAITDTLTGAEGGSATQTTPYAVTGCGNLNFTPKLTASASAQGSKVSGTTFTVVVEAAHGQANIAKTFLQLPVTLPSRLSTIQQACVAKVFEENPAKCDEGSNIGFAVAKTPVLKKPLSGPAYLVSHGNASFPDVEFVLQSEGVEVLLDGKTDIKAGITYSRFETVPDAPVERFETVLPAGPHSALTANVPESEKFNLCKHASQMLMPTEITGQNGDIVRQTTKIALTGVCALPFKETALQKALKACKKKYAHNKKKRVSCERAAKKKYGPKHKAKKKK
jgi:uncharacterized repeat protein (TIGR01451 family)